MTYRPGGGGESRRTISSVEADIRANEREKVLELCVNERKKLTFDSSFATDNVYNEGRLSIIKIIEESLQQKDGDS
jgi:hypothetical protein